MLRRSLAFSLLLVAIALTATSTSADRHYPSWGEDRPTEPSDNLLINPDFEGNYRRSADPHDPSAGPQDQLKLPEGWYPWYDNVPVCPPADPGCNPDSYNRRPEWKRWDENDYPGPLRARSRPAPQMMFNWSATHTAGFYQQASVPPGSWVTFSIWVQVWSNLIDDPHESTLPGDYVVSVGLDPTGMSTEEKRLALRRFREEQYEKLLDAVYKRRGWNKDGIPTLETVRALGIDFPEVVELIEKHTSQQE